MSIQINYCFFSRFLDKTKAPKPCGMGLFAVPIIALRNEKGSYNNSKGIVTVKVIIALRNEKGSYNLSRCRCDGIWIIALRNEKGSYNPLSL